MSELFTITDKTYKVLQCNDGHFLTTFVEGEDDIKEFNAYPKLYVNDDFDTSKVKCLTAEEYVRLSNLKEQALNTPEVEVINVSGGTSANTITISGVTSGETTDLSGGWY